MANPFIKIGETMKRFLIKVVARDFGDASLATGLYHILKHWEEEVPESVKRRIASKVRGRRLREWN